MEQPEPQNERQRAVSQAMLKWFRIEAPSLPEVRDGVINNRNNFYERWKNFTLLPPNPTFPCQELQYKDISISKKEIFLLKPLVFWVPDIFFNSIVPYLPCPHCYKAKEKGFLSMSQSHFNLRPDGWADAPRHVYSLWGSYYVVTKRYRCVKCPNERFYGYDSEVISLLPELVAAQIPCFFTCKNGFDTKTLKLLRRQAVSGQTFDDFANMVNEANMSSFYDSEYMYYCLLLHRKKEEVLLREKKIELERQQNRQEASMYLMVNNICRGIIKG
jgi:hypothetical protein